MKLCNPPGEQPIYSTAGASIFSPSPFPHQVQEEAILTFPDHRFHPRKDHMRTSLHPQYSSGQYILPLTFHPSGARRGYSHISQPQISPLERPYEDIPPPMSRAPQFKREAVGPTRQDQPSATSVSRGLPLPMPPRNGTSRHQCCVAMSADSDTEDYKQCEATRGSLLFITQQRCHIRFTQSCSSFTKSLQPRVSPK